MFRKIHSNRDPKATLYSEIKKEFGTYFNAAGRRSNRLLHAYPKPTFWGMLTLLIFSAILSFTVFRTPFTAQSKGGLSGNVSAQKGAVNRPGDDDGFDRILETGAALRQTLHLKNEVTAILGKGKLGHADSLALAGALDSLGRIHNQINH